MKRVEKTIPLLVLVLALGGCGEPPAEGKSSPSGEEATRAMMTGGCKKPRTLDEIKRGVECKKD